MLASSNFNIQKRKHIPGLSRQTHTKSRTGCQVCKARKIKCSEERPACQNCVHKGLVCIYQSHLRPELPAGRRPPLLLPQPLVYSNSSAVTFTDLRLLHHFLIISYPHLPAGNDSIWTMYVPQIAEHHIYLMHALLSLGASHLHHVSPRASYHAAAVAHRGHALAGFNQAISNTKPAPHEADAMLATVYALTFQALWMEDGLVDFMTMVRGCALITRQLQNAQVSASFDLDPEAYVTTLEPGISQLPFIDKDIITTGLQSLSRLSPILHTQTDLRFFFALKRTLTASLTSTRAGFAESAQIYNSWIDSTSASFNELVDPTNKTATILLAYFTTLQLLLSPATALLYQPPKRAADTSKDGLQVMSIWAYKLFAAVPADMKHYIGWCQAVVEEILREINEDASPRQSRILIQPT